MFYAVILVNLWMLFTIMAKYEATLRQRFGMLSLSLLVFAVLTFLLYTPIISAEGFDQLVNHRSLPDRTWWWLKRKHQDGAFALWAYFVDSSAAWVAVLGFGGLVHAAFISSKFRFLAFAMLLGAVALVFWRLMVPPPETFIYTLFIFHLSSAIALYYLLKFVQEKLFTGFAKRWRTVVTSLILLVAFAWPGMRTAWVRSKGLPEAQWTVRQAGKRLQDGDKLYAEYPWVAPITFEVLAADMDRYVLKGDPATGGTALVVVSEVQEQTVEGVLRENFQDPDLWSSVEMVEERPGMRIFAARQGQSASSDEAR
jgi:hypothetical protein